MTEFEFGTNMPAEVLALAERHFKPIAWLIPKWCRRVTVVWSSQPEDEASLTCEVRFEYRWARICIYPEWLDVPEKIQRDNAIHEVIHIHVNPMFDYANNTLAMLLKDDETFSVHAQAALERLCEGAVQDLADTLQEKLYGNEETKETARQTIARTNGRRNGKARHANTG
jgi:hypothetical protein